MSLRGRIRDEEGAAAVEFAVSATATLAMLIGCFQAFMMLYAYHYVSYATRDATRWAMVRGLDCSSDTSFSTAMVCGAAQSDIQTHLQNLGFPGIDTTKLTATASWYTSNNTTPVVWTLCASGTPTGNCNQPGSLVKVRVTYQYPLSIPFVPSQTVNMSSTSQMVISQ